MSCSAPFGMGRFIKLYDRFETMIKIDTRILNICQELVDRFLASSIKRDEITIFLCGGASKNEAEFRVALGTAIKSLKSKYQYSVYYPERVFVELILGHKRYDLLSLENLLANSVNTVIVPLQSPGTYTELGAFANHPELQNKLTVVIDPKYKRAPSFINTGPIRYLKSKTDSQIIYHEMEMRSVGVLAKNLSEAARKISNLHPIIPSLTNPLTSYEFYLALIFVLDQIPRQTAIQIAQQFESVNKDLVATVAETVINGLINERKIALVGNLLSIPPQGINELLVSFKTSKKSEELLEFLTRLRMNALNIILRGKTYFEWRAAV